MRSALTNRPVTHWKIGNLDRARLGLQSKKHLEKGFWVGIKEGIDEMLESLIPIQCSIEKREVLRDEKIEFLNRLLSCGSVRCDMLRDENGAVTVKIRMIANPLDFDSIQNHLGRYVMALLSPVAYELSTTWEHSQAWPRYSCTCRSPFCGNLFYSGRNDAVACPKKPHAHLTSPCKREWDKYRRWLVAEGFDTDKDWEKKKLQKAYLAQAKSRGPQAPRYS